MLRLAFVVGGLQGVLQETSFRDSKLKTPSTHQMNIKVEP